MDQFNPVNRTSIYANYSPAVRGRIIGLLQGGHTIRDVAAIIGCNKKTVELWKRKYNTGGESSLKDHRKNNRRLRITDPEENQNLIATAARYPFEAAEDIIAQADLRISAVTAQRRLKEYGIVNRIAAKKPTLTDEHRNARINYVTNHLGWHQNIWDRVIWSDEKVSGLVS